jgi:hypothetical protein
MNINLLNLIFIGGTLLYCYKNPRGGILISFLIILGFPATFSYFGFSFGIGEKYLPNIFVIELFYTVYYFFQAGRKGSIEGFDIAIIIYLFIATVVSLLVTEFSLNPGVWVKQFAIFPLFYFMGRVLWMDREHLKENYLSFRNLLLGLGPYMLFFVLLEYFSKINIHTFLLASFKDLVGSVVFSDPSELFKSNLQAYFYRALGPQVEASETALVVCIAFIGYLAWMNVDSPLKRTIRKLMLFLLLAIIVFLATRSVILMLLPLFAIKVVFGGTTKKGVVYFYIFTSAFLFLLVITDLGGIANTILEKFSKTAYYSDRIKNLDTFFSRIWVWEDAWSLIKNHFLFGIGIGTSVYLLGPGASIYTTHNFYLDILLFQGAFVSSLLVILWTALIRRSISVSRKFRRTLLGEVGLTHLMFTFSMLSFGLASPEKIQISSLFWFYGGVVTAGRKQVRISLWKRDR